ncbi:solute carrier family 22 member 6-A-like [Protopterus annectens]|uniref:solute carrier family 22 member 6-A-like n=1 Tax=Protopterus annectens TaxID=7888 RepID=UPI001CF94C57|nr:solute carrier family 22 member 6-A-like [Protopterus annectens]
MGFGDLLKVVGSFGRFQFTLISVLSIPSMFLACQHLLQNFSAATPNHHCKIQLHENDSLHFENLSTQDLLRVSLPLDMKNKPESCFKYTETAWHLLGLNDTRVNGTKIEREPCTDGWLYDTSIGQSTIVTEWDLVCEWRSLKQIGQSVYMGGLLLGAIVFGGLSDRFGRKAVMLGCCLQIAVTGTCAALSPNFTAYCMFRFLLGMAASGILLSATSIVVEWVPDKCRAVTGSLGGYFFTVGQLVLTGLAYAIQNWRWLQFATAAPYFILFVVLWWSPESARWLVLNNKSEVAVKQLKQVAKINGRKEEGEKVTAELVNSSMQMELQAAKSRFTIADLVKTASIRKISFYVSLLWFSNSFAYYALAMDLQNFGFNIYLIQVVFGVIDIPFKLISTITMNFIGRRFNQFACLILPGLAIMSSLFLPEEEIEAILKEDCQTKKLYAMTIKETAGKVMRDKQRRGNVNTQRKLMVRIQNKEEEKEMTRYDIWNNLIVSFSVKAQEIMDKGFIAFIVGIGSLLGESMNNESYLGAAHLNPLVLFARGFAYAINERTELIMLKGFLPSGDSWASSKEDKRVKGQGPVSIRDRKQLDVSDFQVHQI